MNMYLYKSVKMYKIYKNIQSLYITVSKLEPDDDPAEEEEDEDPGGGGGHPGVDPGVGDVPATQHHVPHGLTTNQRSVLLSILTNPSSPGRPACWGGGWLLSAARRASPPAATGSPTAAGTGRTSRYSAASPPPDQSYI